ALAGWDTSAQPATHAPVPRPASLENTPLRTPQEMAEPTMPPNTALMLKAELKIRPNMAGTRVMLRRIRIRATATQATDMKGTTLSATPAITLAPPKITTMSSRV